MKKDQNKHAEAGIITRRLERAPVRYKHLIHVDMVAAGEDLRKAIARFKKFIKSDGQKK
jgi:guanylate kinase